MQPTAIASLFPFLLFMSLCSGATLRWPPFPSFCSSTRQTLTTRRALVATLATPLLCSLLSCFQFSNDNDELLIKAYFPVTSVFLCVSVRRVALASCFALRADVRRAEAFVHNA